MLLIEKRDQIMVHYKRISVEKKNNKERKKNWKQNEKIEDNHVYITIKNVGNIEWLDSFPDA